MQLSQKLLSYAFVYILLFWNWCWHALINNHHYKDLDFEKPIEGIFPNCETQNFTNNLLFILLIYSENLIYLSWVKKFFQILYGSFQPFPPIAAPQFLICFSNHQYSPNLIIWSIYVEQFNSSKISSSHFRGIPKRNTPIFRRALVCFKTYTFPWYHPSAFCGLKGDSDRRRKKKNKKKNKTKLYGRRNKWTWPIQRYWLVFSKTTNFFQRISLLIEIHHFKFTTFCPFSAWEILVTWLGGLKLGTHTLSISTHVVFKLQLSTFSALFFKSAIK